MAKDRETKRRRLRVERVADVPLREVSGICLRRGRDRKMSLVAIGDHAAHRAWTSLPGKTNRKPDWHVVDLTTIEAVCADGGGRVLLLQEAPPRAELVDLDASRVVASVTLRFGGRSPLARSWLSPSGSRGEGAVLLPGGHLLIAKEKDPAAFIEFGPRGARSRGLKRDNALPGGAVWPVASGKQTLVACAVWVPDKTLTKTCADFSDLEIGPDGWLYLLSDKSATIARIDDLAPGGGTASLTTAWRFRDLGGKPEGLAFTAGGSAVVALDKRKPRRNLVLLEPAIAASKGRSQGQKTKPVSRRVARKRAMPVTTIKHGRK